MNCIDAPKTVRDRLNNYRVAGDVQRQIGDADLATDRAAQSAGAALADHHYSHDHKSADQNGHPDQRQTIVQSTTAHPGSTNPIVAW